MKSINNRKATPFIILFSLFSITLISNCSGGPGYVPAGGNNNMCSQNLSPDVKKLLGCPTAPAASTQQLPPSIIIANGGTYGECPSVPTTGPISVYITATDFQTLGPVSGAAVSFFTSTSNTVGTSSPDITATAGQNGITTATLPTGIPFVAKGSSTGYKDTYQFGDLLAGNDAGHFLPVLLISDFTVGLLSSFASVKPDWTNGAVAGEVVDCSGNAIQNAIVSLVDAKTGITVTTSLVYFTYSSTFKADIPDSSLTSTSDNGIFLSINTPPGDYYLVAQGVLPGGNAIVVLGESYVESVANSVSIANILPPVTK